MDYFDGILAHFRPFVKPAGRIDRVISERPDDVWRRISYECPFSAGVESVLYVGYFQSHHHFEGVVDRRRLSDMLGTAAAKPRMGEIYPDAPSQGLFVHVRRGDYKSPAHSIHDLDLRAYYEKKGPAHGCR